MFKRIMFVLLTVGAFALLLNATGMIATAQAPINDDPVRALYMYDRPYTVPANAWAWFKFDFSGDRTKLALITLQNGKSRGLDFRLYTQYQVDNINDDKFVGRGNVAQVPCEGGKCDSQDLTWQGTFSIAGTYYVAVMNPTNLPVPFRILISGDGYSLGNEPPPLILTEPTTTPPGGLIIPQPSTTPLPLSTVAPTDTTSAAGTPLTGLATLTPIVPVINPVNTVPPPIAAPPLFTATPLAPANNSPYNAVYILDNRQIPIAANGELWYKFDYTGDRSQVTLKLPNGNAWGFDFKLYTSDQAFHVYDDDKFVGRGSAVSQSCDAGKCTADDLTWIGNFNVPGTFYVRVINTKPLPQSFALQIAETAINIVGQ